VPSLSPSLSLTQNTPTRTVMSHSIDHRGTPSIGRKQTYKDGYRRTKTYKDGFRREKMEVDVERWM